MVGAVLSVAGVYFTHVRWSRIARIILIIGMGVILCLAFGKISLTLGVIGLIGGMILGGFIPSIINYAWKSARWWMKLIFIAAVITGIVTAIII